MPMLKRAAPGTENGFYANHVQLLLDSYQQLLGRPLIALTGDADAEAFGGQVYRASFALVSHNNEGSPLFNYANRTALQLFERSWEDFIGLPSCYSVESSNAEAREQLLAEVSANGYIKNYAGVRIAKSGRHFRINNAIVWNVHDREGVCIGQAASFSDWEMLP